jgi:FkbH-like protein
LASIIDLPWLPSGLSGVRESLLTLRADQPALGEDLRRIAGHRLKASEAAQFGKRMRQLKFDGATLAPLSPVSLAVVSNNTFDLVLDELPAAAARHGIALNLTVAPFDQVMQSALDPASEINKAGIDAVLLAVDHRWFGLTDEFSADPKKKLADAIDQLISVVTALKRNSTRTIVLQTLPVPPQPLFGSYDARVAVSQRSLIRELNAAIIATAADTSCIVLDVAGISGQVGTDRWFDPKSWNLYKLPFSPSCNAIYADFVGRLLGSMRGRARKCLVLDLDNTLWGGVIGDDGIDALRIGQGSAEGESFLAVQRLALSLKERGVILAVASKNGDEVARGPFRNHPDMLLRENDIAVFQANWLDKPSNLEAIAKQLSIGVDALVFLDDNSAERAQVRAALPSVAVPELPADPAWFPWYLANAGYFEALSFSSEDRLRAASYLANARRAEVSAKARDLGDYLVSLEIEIQFASFDGVGRSRIAQLINKSNQFNLTTRRYAEADVAAYERNPSAITLQVRLADRFGDFGMIGVIIGLMSRDSIKGEILTLDTWLMSCRVLGRRVEEAMLGEVVRLAKDAGIKVIVGVYIPSEKNYMVADHYVKLGFTKMAQRENGECYYSLEVASYREADLPYKSCKRSSVPAAVLV